MGIVILLASIVLLFYSVYGAMERRIDVVTLPPVVSSDDEICNPLPYLPAAVQLFRCNDTLQVRQYFDENSYYSINLSIYDVIAFCENICK